MLAQFLKVNQTESCGTVCSTRRHYLVFPNAQWDDCVTLKSRNMLALRWHDKRSVYTLTTVYKGEMQDSGKVEWGTSNPILKPSALLNYNVNMRLVDKSDMMISMINCLRKSLTCVLNAFILYCQQYQGTTTTLQQLEMTVVKELLQTYGMVVLQQDLPI